MARTIYGDHQRFMEAYFKPYPGHYFTGDGAYRTEGGYYQITGRMDDVINISGHRLGTAEIEDAMANHPAVPETAVIGYPHDIKGEGERPQKVLLIPGLMHIVALCNRNGLREWVVGVLCGSSCCFLLSYVEALGEETR